MPFTSKNIIIIEKVDSTNNYAMGLIQNGKATNENAVFAWEQTNGKGRRGKNWKSNKGENIVLSVIFQMQWLPISGQFQLSAATALACLDMVSKYVPSGTSVKWPNDIFINDTKAGGILIENVLKGTIWQWAVIGIGLNINQVEFDEPSFSATSLKQIIGKDYNVLEMAKDLYTAVLKRMHELKTGNFQKMLEEYNEKLFAKNRVVKLKKENIVFETTVIGVSESGQLITRDAFERNFNFDEVEFKGLV